MIIHIALFRWKKNISKNHVGKIASELRLLKRKSEGLIDIFCGENFSNYSKGFDYGIVVLFKDKVSLETYRNLPEHKNLAQEIEKIEEDSVGFDFEV